MIAKTVEAPVLSEASHKAAFFRQSGWMMMATVGSGVLMMLVHVYSKFIPAEEYSAVGTLIQLLNWMMIPAIGLQTVFAQQTSAAITGPKKRQLAGTFRAVLQMTFCIWLLMLVVTFLFQGRMLSAMKIHNPAALWVTVVVGLMMLWQPIFQGLLQGRQNFLWLGWVAVFNAIGRVVIAGLIVVLLHGWAAGIMTGALIGLVALVTTAAWQNRDLWSAPRDPFAAREWLRRVVPLTLGCGASQFLFSADMMIVQDNFSNTSPYVLGMTLARAIVLFTAPLVAVMFPKIVHSLARDQKSNLLTLTCLGTTALAVMAAIALPIVSPLLIKAISTKENLAIVPLMPLFAWSMVPLAVANVLLNNLMARSRFAAVPWLVLVVVGYWLALLRYHASYEMVVGTLGLFASLFLIVCALFTWVFTGAAKPAVARAE